MDEKIAQLKSLVAELKNHQDTVGLSDRKMVAKFKNTNGRPLLGSAKTWVKLVEGDYSGLNLDRWVQQIFEVKSQVSGGARSTKFFKEMPITAALDAELDRLEAAANDRRCLMCLAPTGVGKSMFIHSAVKEEPATRMFAAAHPGWRNSMTNICCGIIAAIGETQSCYAGNAAALDKLTALLSSPARTIFIDEAHDGGVVLMRIIRHLIDRTPTRFFYSGYPTEFDAVRSATAGAVTEAQQFLGRCQKPIFEDYRDGTKPEDVAFYLHKALGFPLKGDAKTVAEEITPILQRRYNLRLLDDAVEMCEIEAQKDEKEVTPDQLILKIKKLAALPAKGAAR
jgi:hypothetical protein